MDCKRVEEMVWALCEGSLDSEATAAIESHLLVCPRCRKAKQDTAAVMEALQGLSSIEAGDEFRSRLWERIDAVEASRRVIWLGLVASFLRRNRRLIATCCVVFGVSLAAGIFILRNMTDEPATLAETPPVTRDFAIREIEPSSVVSVSDGEKIDTVYTRFVTREFAIPQGPQPENYVFEPVVAPVSAGEEPF